VLVVGYRYSLFLMLPPDILRRALWLPVPASTYSATPAINEPFDDWLAGKRVRDT